MKNGFILDGKEYYSLNDSNFKVNVKIEEKDDIITRRDKIHSNKPCNIDYKSFLVIENFTGNIKYYEHIWCREWTIKKWNWKKSPLEIHSYGRTTNAFYPYMLIHNKDTYMAFNLLPWGDWRIRLEMKGEDLYIIVDRDNYRYIDGDLDIKLDWFIVENKDLNNLYIKQQNYVRKNYFHNKNVPVSYNTWIDQFYNLNWDNLINQIDTAAYIGCETFIVDAGWFGTLKGWLEIGNWTEKENLFENGKTLVDLADYVRQKGMNFGIWMELMKIHENAPLRKKYPELFVAADDTYYHYDFNNPKAMDLMFDEACKVIRKYNAKWIKIDNNHGRAKTHGDPHVEASEKYFEFLHRLEKEFPDLIIENCSSGGMSGDILTMSNYATSFPTDTVFATELIRVQKEACKVYPPCFINNWACCNPVAQSYTVYDKDPFDTNGYALNPKDAVCHGMEVFPIEYIFATNFLGNLSFTGNLAGFSKKDKHLMADLVKLYKYHKDFIFKANYIELESDGYAYLLANNDFSEALLFVFNTNEISYNEPVRIRVKTNPLPEKEYKAVNLLTGKKEKVGKLYSKKMDYREVKIIKLTEVLD